MKIQTLAILCSLFFLFSNCRKEETPPINHKEEMRQLVQNISVYTKDLKSNFAVIPHNGEELVTKNGKIDSSPALDYLASIDAIGRDAVFFGLTNHNEETPTEDKTNIIQFLDFAKDRGISIMVTDFCNTPEKVDSSYARNLRKGYLPFVADHQALDNVPPHPSPILNENSTGVKGFGSIENFIVLLNPNFGSKQAFIDAMKNSNYDLLIMDAYYNGEPFTTYELDQLKEKENGGLRRLLAYVNIGEVEKNRFYWQTEWNEKQPEWIGSKNEKGNYEIEYWQPEWHNILYNNKSSYLFKMVSQGYNGVYLGGIDAFENYD